MKRTYPIAHAQDQKHEKVWISCEAEPTARRIMVEQGAYFKGYQTPGRWTASSHELTSEPIQPAPTPPLQLQANVPNSFQSQVFFDLSIALSVSIQGRSSIMGGAITGEESNLYTTKAVFSHEPTWAPPTLPPSLTERRPLKKKVLSQMYMLPNLFVFVIPCLCRCERCCEYENRVCEWIPAVTIYCHLSTVPLFVALCCCCCCRYC